jgi:hypothetical protein
MNGGFSPILNKEQDDSRCFEKWMHAVLLKRYSNLELISEQNEPLLHLYVSKAKKLEQKYSEGYSSSSLELMKESNVVEELAEEYDREKRRNSASSVLDVKSRWKQLNFPFDQLSEGVFLGYILEILADVKKDTFVSKLKKEFTYRIQVI